MEFKVTGSLVQIDGEEKIKGNCRVSLYHLFRIVEDSRKTLLTSQFLTIVLTPSALILVGLLFASNGKAKEQVTILRYKI